MPKRITSAEGSPEDYPFTGDTGFLVPRYPKERPETLRAKAMRDAKGGKDGLAAQEIRKRVLAKQRPSSKDALFRELSGTIPGLSHNAFLKAWKSKDAQVPKSWKHPGARAKPV